MHKETLEAGSLKMNTALEYSTRVVQEGGCRCKKSTLNDLVHLIPLRIPLMNTPLVYSPNTSRESKLSIAQLSKKKNFLYPFFLYNMGWIKPKKHLKLLPLKILKYIS